MTTVLILLLLALTTLALVRMAAAVRGDGYGRRPGPRSHYGDTGSPWGPLPH